MIFTETKLKGAFLVEVKKIEDERGFFGRAWCQQEFEDHGLNGKVCQLNTSFSKHKGTIRGMHYQVDPYQETKFIRCTRGAIFDVMIDLRPESPTFLQWVGNVLTADNYAMAYVPENFAHGFITLEENSEVYYPVTQFYTPGAERGFRYNDPTFNVEWPVEALHVSEKDMGHADFNPETFQS